MNWFMKDILMKFVKLSGLANKLPFEVEFNLSYNERLQRHCNWIASRTLHQREHFWKKIGAIPKVCSAVLH